MEAFRVSVVIPVYNAAAFVASAVRSATSLRDVGEVVLVEDGSTDDSLSVCQELMLEDGRVILLRHPNGVNLGAGASRNLALAHCTCPFVAFLDADDLFLTNRFDEDRRVFDAHPDADGVYGAIGATFHDDSLKVPLHERFGSDITTARWRVPPEQLLAALLEEPKGFGHFSLDALTVKRSSLARMPYLFAPELRLHQDSEFIIRLAFHARLYPGSIEAPVAVRGVHQGNRIFSMDLGHQSKKLMYDRLVKWASSVRLKASLKRKLVVQQVHHAVHVKQSWIALLFLGRRFIGDLWLLNKAEIRKPYFDALLGADSRASVFMQKVTWRLLN